MDDSDLLINSAPVNITTPTHQLKVNGKDGNNESKQNTTPEHSSWFAPTLLNNFNVGTRESAPVPTLRKQKIKRVGGLRRESLNSNLSQTSAGLTNGRKENDEEDDMDDKHVIANDRNLIIHTNTGPNVELVSVKPLETTRSYISLIVDELINTEVAYVKDLGEVVEVNLSVFCYFCCRLF